MIKAQRLTLTLLTPVLAGLLAWGCSKESPTGSASQLSSGLFLVEDSLAVDFEGTIATTDSVTRALTFTDSDELVTVAPDAVILGASNDDDCDDDDDGEEQDSTSVADSLTFADLLAGDRVRVHGSRQADSTVLADTIQVLGPEDDDEDEIKMFKSTIVSIDTVEGSFTVVDRSETILVTDATRFQGRPGTSGSGHGDDDDDGEDCDEGGRGKGNHANKGFGFDDLQPGDPVKVHYIVTDSATLEAVRIQLMKKDMDEETVEFVDALATVDAAGGVVTFETQTWIGVVDSSASLSDSADVPVGLGAFLPGQVVEVKGITRPGDTLLVVRMEMEGGD